MLCKLCQHPSEKRFEALILNKYPTSHYACTSCGFLQTDEPVWLDEAYQEAINACDTGIIDRNNQLREMASVIIYYFFGSGGRFLDYAGGYGIFTRLMRDVGFDYYWCDKYSENIFANASSLCVLVGVSLFAAESVTGF